jgi:hypothetical protein
LLPTNTPALLADVITPPAWLVIVPDSFSM